MIHHLNCGAMRPYPAALINGRGGLFAPSMLSCRVLLVEAPHGLVLIDTGFGRAEVVRPELVRLRRMLRPEIRESETAARQIAARGLDPARVTDILMTHCDVDHAGGLPEFPRARVHLSQAELHSIKADLRQRAPRRYHRHQFAHGPLWRAHNARASRWKGMAASEPIRAAGAEFRLVSLPGHTRGHCGVAVRDGAGWLLHVGDATYFEGDLLSPRRRPPAVLRWFTHFAAQRAATAEESLLALRRLLAEHADVQAVCAHDPRWLGAGCAAQAGAAAEWGLARAR